MDKATRATQVSEQVCANSSVIGTIEQQTTELFKRLKPLIRDCPPPPPSGSVDKAEEVLVDHAATLKGMHMRLTLISETLDSIIDRLEF